MSLFVVAPTLLSDKLLQTWDLYLWNSETVGGAKSHQMPVFHNVAFRVNSNNIFFSLTTMETLHVFKFNKPNT